MASSRDFCHRDVGGGCPRGWLPERAETRGGEVETPETNRVVLAAPLLGLRSSSDSSWCPDSEALRARSGLRPAGCPRPAARDLDT